MTSARIARVLAVSAALVAVLGAGLVTTKGQAQIFSSTDAAVTIPDNSTTPGCMSIVVAGGPTSITDVNVEITMAHTWVGDLHMRLLGPGGAPIVTLVNRPGRQGTGTGDSSDLQAGFPITFNDQLATVSAEQMGGSNATETGCASGGVIGSSAGCTLSLFQPSATSTDTPVASSGTNLGDFNGLNANGTWQLCISDHASADTGTINLVRLGFNGTLPVQIQRFAVD